jgi:signal transduction histidine kinase
LAVEDRSGKSGRRRIGAVLAMPAIFPGPASQARLAGRLGLGAFVVLVGVGIVTRLGQDPLQTAVGAGMAVAAAVPLFLIRPRLGLGLAAVATAGVVLLGNADSRAIVWFALVVLAGWSVLSGGVAVGIAYWIGTLLLFGAEWLWAIRDPGWAPWAAGVTVSVLAALLIRHEFVLVDRLRAAQADLTERTRAEERTRIARELHDVIAHSLTVALLHVTSARLAVEYDPEDAARALAEAERLGRQSLTEVRATMGLLRETPSEEAATGVAPPVPGFGDIPALIDQLRRAGAEVSLALHGDLKALPETAGATVYRIIQESLTNATRHALGTPVAVRVEAADSSVEVYVDSAGPAGSGSGMGLTNMAERARALGGTCTAGVGPSGSGWLVHASLPARAEQQDPL